MANKKIKISMRGDNKRVKDRIAKKRAEITSKKSEPANDNFGLSEEDLDMPPLYDPSAKTNFTDEELEKLTATDNDESVRLAFGKAALEEKPLWNKKLKPKLRA